MQTNPWLLPEGVQEVLPPESWRLEGARRQLLDMYWRWGYDLVRPPLIEYLDSLLTGSGHDLDLQTFKLVDQMSGRTMGVRSDMTTQVARIDAHRPAAHTPVRYCYIGSILHTRPEEPGGSRAPLQIGVEMFGATDNTADLEIVSLMLETLGVMGIERVTLDLGHVAIYRGLVECAGISADLEPTLFDIVQRKSLPELETLRRDQRISARAHRWFADLIQLDGPPSIMAQAQQCLGGIDPIIDAAFDSLRDMLTQLQRHYPQVDIVLDLAELRGYRYKTGLLYAAFAPGVGRELARGGRYDEVGAVFGRARPATGFSADLNLLAEIGGFGEQRSHRGIHAPADTDEQLLATIRELRANGERVIVATSGGDSSPAELGCDRVLRQRDGSWQVFSL